MPRDVQRESLQRLPQRSHPDSHSPSVVRITGIALVGIGTIIVRRGGHCLRRFAHAEPPCNLACIP